MRLYHWTKKENLKAILVEGLTPNGMGIVYLSKFPKAWVGLHNDGVLLEVETGDNKLTAFEENQDGSEILCWGKIPPEKVNKQ